MITYIYSPPTENIWSPWSVSISSNETVHLCPLSRAQLLVFRQCRDNFHFSVFWKCVCIINLGGSGCVRTDDRGGGVTINHQELGSSNISRQIFKRQTSHRIHHDCGRWSPGAWCPALTAAQLRTFSIGSAINWSWKCSATERFTTLFLFLVTTLPVI